MILVTGANGYIGQHIVKALTDQGKSVRAFVRQGISQNEETFLKECGAQVLAGDLLQKEDLQKAVDQVESVIHLVGSVNKPKNEDFMTMHQSRTKALVEALKNSSLKKIIFVSTLGASFRSDSQYQVTKWEAEEVIRKSGLNYVILRSALIFGKQVGSRDSKLITKMVDTVKNGPFIPKISHIHGRIQPIYIGDLVHLVLTAMEHSELQRNTLEVGGPEKLTSFQLMEKIADTLGIQKKKKKLPFFLVRFGVCLMEKISQSPKMTLEQLNLMRQDNTVRFSTADEYFNPDRVSLFEGLSYLKN